MNHRGPISKLIGGGIGLAQEYKADRKERKEHQSAATPSTPDPEASSSSNVHPANASNPEHDAFSDDESISDDEEWAVNLDEAQQVNYSTSNQSEDIDAILKRFALSHPPPPYSQQRQTGALPMPVILPQRRPESRHRGFIRAYAPVLEQCAISEAAWLDFLDGFEKSISGNSWFHVANAAVFVAGKVRLALEGISIIAHLVTLAIHVSLEAGRRTYIHGKQNKYLDVMNEQFFQPRGLYCLVIKYKPKSNEAFETTDINRNITQSVAERDSEDRQWWKNWVSSSDSTTKHEEEIPEAAPLVFPGLDNASAEQKENAVKHFGHFVTDYYDRQAQARFAGQHPDSKLDVAPRKEFASRYSDPNHPASQGGLASIVSGGKWNPVGPLGRVRGRRNDRREKVGLGSRPVGREGRQQRRSRRPLRRMLKQDALYLMVVNMPTQEEMAAVMAEVERAKAQSSC